MLKHRSIFIILFSLLVLALSSVSVHAACMDLDGDGYGSPGDASCPKGSATDCDDSNPKTYPDAARICDGKDNDCDGRLDFSTDVDKDHDGYPMCVSALGADCNDNDSTVYPGAQEGPYGDNSCSDGKDNNCNGKKDTTEPACSSPCVDKDGDGYGNPGSSYCPKGAATDCNDNNSNINPDKTDTNCNGIDENCSGTADEGYVPTPSTCGVGACAATGQNICQNGAVVNNCTPGAPQTEGPYGDPTCSDGIDNNCNGQTDAADGFCASACIDNDNDGYGSNGSPLCQNGTAIDCNDNDPNINPGASDANCNGINEDCDQITDDNYVPTPTQCGIGICARTGQLACQNGAIVNTCTPGTPQTEGPYGNATCGDGKDNNCNGLTDAADPKCSSVCTDNDGDGYGVSGAPCSKGTKIDCDDTDPKVYPGASRICDGKDNDCDGRIDFSTDKDIDKDGVPVCAGDCNDNNANISPKKKEGAYGDPTCGDGLDNDCDKKVDTADPGCAAPTCVTKTSPKNGPHFFTLLNPDNTVHSNNAALDCGKCHNTSNFQDSVRYQCQRCHADSNDTSDPLNGTLKAQYPLNPPYGFGTAKNMKMHSGNLNLKCVTCHNPHQQEQDLKYGTTYGKYIKEYVCFDNTAAGGSNFQELIKFTAPTGSGSFADGAPYNANVCEMCHTQTNHHRRDGTAPGDLNGGTYVGHYDGSDCIACHVHSEGFKFAPPAIDSGYVGSSVCGACHADIKADFDESGHPYKYRATNGVTPTDPLTELFPAPFVSALNSTTPDRRLDADSNGVLDWPAINYAVGGYGWKLRWGINDMVDNTLTGYVWSSTLSGASGAQYNMLSVGAYDPLNKRADWSSYGSATGQSKAYNCAVCHNTNGTNAKSSESCYTPLGSGRTEPWANNPSLSPAGNHGGYYSEWTFDGVQCEACHGPGDTHTSAPSKTNIGKNTSLDACGACHTRAADDKECFGTGPIGAMTNGATDGFGKHHEQYNEMVGYEASGAGKGVHASLLTCVTCHDPHKRTHKVPGEVATALGITDNNLSAKDRGAVADCAACHEAQKYAIGGANSSAAVAAHNANGIDCIDCHMAEATKSATGIKGTWGKKGDVKSHIVKVNPDPAAATVGSRTNSFGKTIAENYLSVDYVCGKCHDPDIFEGGYGYTAGATLPGGITDKTSASAVATNYHNVTGIDGGYVGSNACWACHTTQYNNFAQSGHPYKVRTTAGATPTADTDPLSALLSSNMPWISGTPSLNDDASVPDFQIDLDGDGKLDWSSVQFVIGGYGWKARWGILDTSGNDRTGYIWSSAGKMAQFNMLAADPGLDPLSKRDDWSSYGSASGQSKKYECAVCHNTNGMVFTAGYSCYKDPAANPRTQPWASLTGMDPFVNHGGFYSQWSFDGVQCEECHGPAVNHVNYPSANLPAVNTSKDTCGKCHIRAENTSGASAECGGDSNPAILTNGAKISGDYIQHHEQYNELVGLNDGVHITLECVSCHNPHKRSHKVTDAIATALGITDNDLSAEARGAVISCESCHQPGTPDAAEGGADTKVSALQHTGSIKCIDCHMAEATKSATNESPDGAWGRKGDVRTHIFKIDPAASTITRSNGFVNVATNALSVKYSCGKCHDSSMSSYVGSIPLTEEEAKAAAAAIHLP